MVNYYVGKNRSIRHYYSCNHDNSEYCKEICQSMIGLEIDALVGNLFLQVIKINNINLAIQTINVIEKEKQQVLKHWKQKLQRVQYEQHLAKTRYEACDPKNRLVAATLEEEWNKKLELVKAIETEIEELERCGKFQLTVEQKEQIRALASNLLRIWKDPRLTSRDRKSLIRTVISDVTILRNGYAANIAVRWKTGLYQTMLSNFLNLVLAQHLR